MNSSEKYLEEIARELLPKGAVFSDQQKNAILQDGTMNIVAGPGSGKTTVLTAKCALLLNENKNNNNNRGICLITHTNVAVDEIKISLRKVDFKEVVYPNFIGTIQEFFNTFFAKKAFHMILGSKKFRVLEDEEYQEKFESFFNFYKPSWYTMNCPNVFKNNPTLKIFHNKTFEISSDTKPSYRDSLNNSVEALFKLGLVTNKQCLELAKWYIEKYESLIRKAITNRFSYVLLDEAQDTNKLQYDLLNQLFYNNGLSFQRYGDPYQALYNIYEDEGDVWIPTNEVDRIPKYDISETSRFNENITRIVRNLCIESYEEFKSLEIVDSFKPHFLIYENEKDLIKTYKELIKELESKSGRFASSTKKDAILSVRHDELSAIFNSYSKPTIKLRKNESNTKQAYNFLLGILSKELDLSFKDAKQKIDSNLECKKWLGIAIRSLLIGQDNKLIQSYLDRVLNSLLEQNESTLSNLNLDELCTSFRMGIAISEHQRQDTNDNFYIGTIHSVKGETHRSTLLVLNSVFKDYSVDESYTIVELLENYLIGDYIAPSLISDFHKRKETCKALKLAYVALSRPTHLAAIAIPKSLVTPKLVRSLNYFEWVEYKLNKYSILPV
ncbi:UvrD-helicase domain-containing protein [Cytobacillus horneckiae]|uniref:UvrD-helicase domain-containing protein n=1 Tax=Cytobacillus horneckiae TaxID=549687 RepID=UPI002041DD2A|nr:UvrD-helicase domain-containing protein [Cytobacillus horneckiae]MCM3181169.1 UvrD-helicase domain-containing protein [Cytobacillus horneckiae]